MIDMSRHSDIDDLWDDISDQDFLDVDLESIEDAAVSAGKTSGR